MSSPDDLIFIITHVTEPKNWLRRVDRSARLALDELETRGDARGYILWHEARTESVRCRLYGVRRWQQWQVAFDDLRDDATLQHYLVCRRLLDKRLS